MAISHRRRIAEVEQERDAYAAALQSATIDLTDARHEDSNTPRRRRNGTDRTKTSK